MTDVVVIGAGAAGLAAARTLSERGLAVTTMEARERIGGRAWTESDTFGLPIDRGCAWLHSADVNPWVAIARRLGLSVIERNPDWGRLIDGRQVESAERQAIDAMFEAVEAAGGRGRDVSAADVLPADDPLRPVFDAVMSWVSGVETAAVSTLDHARYAWTDNDWPVREGYGALVACYGAGLPVALGTPATAIDWSGRGVRVTTTKGTIAARAAVVTLPVALLAEDAVRFEPGLPAAKRAAVEAVPLGIANKVFVEVAGDPFGLPEGCHMHASAATAETTTIELRPFGRPLAIAYFGGPFADRLEAAGPAAMTDFAVGELVRLFGSDLRRRVGRTSTTAWRRDPWARGAYSAARPGRADSRAELAAPLADRLFFAGEACSIDAYSTCNGAYLSGVAAAEAAADALRK